MEFARSSHQMSPLLAAVAVNQGAWAWPTGLFSSAERLLLPPLRINNQQQRAEESASESFRFISKYFSLSVERKSWKSFHFVAPSLSDSSASLIGRWHWIWVSFQCTHLPYANWHPCGTRFTCPFFISQFQIKTHFYLFPFASLFQVEIFFLASRIFYCNFLTKWIPFDSIWISFKIKIMMKKFFKKLWNCLVIILDFFLIVPIFFWIKMN